MALNVCIDDRRISIGGDGLFYSGYYIDDFQNRPRFEIMSEMFRQWADVLERMNANETVYLPYSPNDQDVDCFRAKIDGNSVKLRCVNVDFEGWSLDLGGIADFCRMPHTLVSECEQDFGTYDREELVAGLRNPESRFEE